VQSAPIARQLRLDARRQPGCKALMKHHGIGELTRRPCPAIFRKRWCLEAWQLSEQIFGRLLAMVVDAMSGMVTQVRPPRRDEMNAYYRALPLCDPGKLQPNRHTGDANA
jgi:hypothetical protein